MILLCGSLSFFSPLQENLLVVAGGGGGTRGRDDEDFNGSDASLDINGTNGLGNEFGKGGCNGDPGEDADLPHFRGPCWGYGGAGVLKNATTADCFPSGGKGGRNGGFGGGGGAGSWGGGGGGGYSGGGSGRGGGGGGSYVRADATDVVKQIGNECDGSILIEVAEPPYPLTGYTGSSGYGTSESRLLQSYHSSASSTGSAGSAGSAGSKYISTLSSRTSSDDMIEEYSDATAKARPGKPMQSIVESHLPAEYPPDKLPQAYQIADSGTQSPAEVVADFLDSRSYVSPNSTSMLTNPTEPLKPVQEVQDEAIFMHHVQELPQAAVMDMVSNYPYTQASKQLHSSQAPVRYTEPVYTPPTIPSSNSVPVTLDQMPYPPASVVFNNPPDSNSQADFDLAPNSNAHYAQP